MKTKITKKLFAFIIMVFSVSFADAQCVCYCTAQPRNNAECFTKANGTLGCRQSRCRDRVAMEQSIETATLFIYPNPLSTSTTLSFYVEERKNVSVKIFDVSGRIVTTLANTSLEEGDYEITWNASEANPGIYFLRMEAAGYLENQKLIVTK